MPSLVRSLALLALLLVPCVHAEWKTALPGWKYKFPRDHGNHPGFKTEWWYFTGNLKTSDGREFGYQLTFFRQGIQPPDAPAAASRFVTRDFKFAHFTVSEVTGRKFHFFQKLSRGAFGEAGFDEGSRLAWIDEWSCETNGPHSFRLSAKSEGIELELDLNSEKSPVIHGENGVSQKAEGEGRASHYYSVARLKSEGSLRIAGQDHKVTGTSWFDHEWATNQLAPHQIGWDWFSIQLDDNSELMLFQLRTNSGARDEHSSGTFVDSKGSVIAIVESDFRLTPTGRKWKSPKTGAEYPTSWRVEIPKLALSLEVRAALDDQELYLKPISYWEGAIRAEGTKANSPIRGSGYLEMTGYAGAIVGMQQP